MYMGLVQCWHPRDSIRYMGLVVILETVLVDGSYSLRRDSTSSVLTFSLKNVMLVRRSTVDLRSWRRGLLVEGKLFWNTSTQTQTHIQSIIHLNTQPIYIRNDVLSLYATLQRECCSRYTTWSKIFNYIFNVNRIQFCLQAKIVSCLAISWQLLNVDIYICTSYMHMRYYQHMRRIQP